MWEEMLKRTVKFCFDVQSIPLRVTSLVYRMILAGTSKYSPVLIPSFICLITNAVVELQLSRFLAKKKFVDYVQHPSIAMGLWMGETANFLGQFTAQIPKCTNSRTFHGRERPVSNFRTFPVFPVVWEP